jgi:hypothetical protein
MVPKRLQVIVDGSQVKPVIQWQQYIRDDEITDEVTNHHLEIRKETVFTVPGTEMKVTPLNEVPIIPKATSHHLEFLLPMKKVSLSECREVLKATPIKMRKYPITKLKTSHGDIYGCVVYVREF